MAEETPSVGVGPIDPDRVILTPEILDELQRPGVTVLADGRVVGPRMLARWLVRLPDGTARLQP